MFSHLQGQRLSLCGALRDRQLFGTKILARPFLADFESEDQCILNNPGLVGSPAFACEYSKVYNGGKFLALADEEGFISIIDTAAALPRSTADDDDPKPRAQWLAHRNAVFDIAWAKDDAWMLAASGDQTISLWDTGLAEPLGTFRSHTGSVKSVCPQPGCHDVFASGARDGVLMVWDARVPAVSEGQGEPFHKPVVSVQDAHAPDEKKRKSRRTPLQGRSKPSVTSVLFADSTTLATGGVDGILKLWDLRQAGSPVARQSTKAQLGALCSVALPSIGIKQHGITSLALHPNGVELLVSLTGGHHMMYQLHRPEIGPTKLFGGHTVASFYVKAAFSPDGSHILSGSTDRKVYIWQVEGGDSSQPYTLEGHEGEVTAVSWCPTDLEQIATTADDATLRVWSVRRKDRAVREVPDVRQPDWQAAGVGSLPASALASPGSRRASAAYLSQPTTPQVATGRRTPADLQARYPSAAASPLAPAFGADENEQGNFQQQQQPGAVAAGVAQTPAAAGPGSPSAALPGSVWRPGSTVRRPRSVAELHAALGSQQRLRRTKQQSIASFLSPPAPAAASPKPAQAEAAEGGSAAAAAAEPEEGAGPSSSAAAAATASRTRRMPLSPRLKRLRVSFEPAQGLPSGSGAEGGEQPASAAGAAGGSSAAAAAASVLEPSPTNLAAGCPPAPGAAAMAGRQGCERAFAFGSVCKSGQPQQAQQRQPMLQRKGSADENAASNAAV